MATIIRNYSVQLAPGQVVQPTQSSATLPMMGSLKVLLGAYHSSINKSATYCLWGSAGGWGGHGSLDGHRQVNSSSTGRGSHWWRLSTNTGLDPLLPVG